MLRVYLVVAIAPFPVLVQLYLDYHEIICVLSVLNCQDVVVAADRRIQMPRENCGERTLDSLAHLQSPDFTLFNDVEAQD